MGGEEDEEPLLTISDKMAYPLPRSDRDGVPLPELSITVESRTRTDQFIYIGILSFLISY